MEFKIDVYECLCELSKFEINGVIASYEDFGDKCDMQPGIADAYCCGDMQFIPKSATQEILDKYKTNINKYNLICEELSCLSFGYCSLCL